MSERAPVAAIDCGTNSIRLLIASVADDGTVVSHERLLELVRLGEGVDATGVFSAAALERTFAACGRYATIIDKYGCEKIRFVATSAARDVDNREEFYRGVEARLGVSPEIISGVEEAELSFAGALSGINIPDGRVLVTDCGGGSTEFVLGDSRGGRSPSVINECSLNMGSVRITERFFGSVPPELTDIQAARRFVNDLLDQAGIDFGCVDWWVGVAGTVTSLSAIHQGLTSYDPDKVHNSRLTREDISRLAEKLLVSSVDEIMSYGPLQRRRAEVIAAGSLIIDEVARRIPGGLIVSETDILDGIVRRLWC